MSSPMPLTPAAELGELLLEEAQVTPQTLGRTVAQQFESRRHLPGVLVLEGDRLIGAISRRQFYQKLSRPYAPEIFLKRPIRVFLDLTPHCRSPLVLDYQEPVTEAVQKGLTRPAQALFEPIVVAFSHPQLPKLRSYFLIDFQTLMLTHAQIATSVTATVQQQKHLLEQERSKAHAHARQLEAQQREIQTRNRLLESQKRKLVNQSQQIQALNHRFVEIGQVLSKESKRAFQATFAGVNAICHNTDQIVEVGHDLESELDAIYEMSGLVRQVSRQVHHLSVQAAIFANQANTACNTTQSCNTTEFNGFTYITDEIGKLMRQTSEAGRQMNTLADRFGERVKSFTESAQTSTVTARSMISEIEQAAIALTGLENLMRQSQDLPSFVPVAAEVSPAAPAPPPSLDAKRASMQTLSRRLAQAESTLTDLRRLIDNKTEEHKSAESPFVQRRVAQQ